MVRKPTRVRESGGLVAVTDSARSDGDTEGVTLSRVDAKGAVVIAGDVGNTISRYVVLEEIGVGGMGRVLRAYDPRLQREVAVKVLRANALSEEASQRLINEARAMAKVSHPNVVQVYDVETLDDGQIVLVMQFVLGDTLRSWVKETYPWREVVDTLVAAGRGLAAAHAAGLLHRDFKPANVLLSQTGRVKVTDFGLAKPSSSTLSMGSGEYLPVTSTEPKRETQTEAGVVLGTPRYMAPEQHTGRELTSAADQYAFCVTLWEALCGTPPFSGKGMSKRKHEGPPPWTGREVPRFVVDAVLRGLSADPEERWPSMEALLERLVSDPAKRRNKVLGLVGVGTLVAATAVSGWQAYVDTPGGACRGARDELETAWGQARRDAVQAALTADDTPYARSRWSRTETRLDAYGDAWVDAHQEACEATAVRGVQSEAVLDLRMACLRAAELDFRAVTGVLANADADVLQNADAVLDGLPPVERCADIERLQDVEPPPPSFAEQVRMARMLLAESEAERNGGRYEEALHRLDEAKLALMGVDYAPARGELALEEGKVLEATGRYEDAVAPLQDAVRLHAAAGRRALVRDATTQLLLLLGKRLTRFDEALALVPVAEGFAQGHPLEEADVANTLALVLVEKGDVQQAEEAQRRAFKLRLEALGPDHTSLANSHHALALVLTAQSRHAEATAEHERALEIWEAALGREHPNVSMALVNVATSYFHQGMYEQAESTHREALRLREAALGPKHPEVLHARVNFALTLCRQGQWKACGEELEQALELQKTVLGADHRALARTHVNLAVAKQAQGLFDEAAEHNQRGLEISERTLGPDHHDTAVARINIANDLARRGKHAEAADAYRKALETLERTLGKRHASVAIACNNLAAMLEEQDLFGEAEAYYRRALEIRLEMLGEEHPTVATVRTALARVLLERGATEEALTLAEKAWAKADRAAPLTWAEAAFTLARAAVGAKENAESRRRARALLVSAREGYREAEATEDLAKVDAWARLHRVY